jgi:hypothetical protein
LLKKKSLKDTRNMFELPHIQKKIKDLQLTMTWLIKGAGRHGLKVSDVKHIDWNWIKNNYNVDDFQCQHKKVTNIGYVIGFGDKGEPQFIRVYDGLCEHCNSIVLGKTTLDGKVLSRWK